MTLVVAVINFHSICIRNSPKINGFVVMTAIARIHEDLQNLVYNGAEMIPAS